MLIPAMDAQQSEIVETSKELENGLVTPLFEQQTSLLEASLTSLLGSFDNIITHNIFTKHFNLPLTAALSRIRDKNKSARWIAWCHDITWTSPHSRSKVHPGYPWDLLRSYRPDVTYVTVSRRRQQELAGLFGCPLEEIPVIYNGVDPKELLGLSSEEEKLLQRLDLWQSDLILLMPVRVTQAKNIEYAFGVVAALKENGIRPKLIVTGPPDPYDDESIQYYRSLLELRQRLHLEKEMSFIYESGPDPEVAFTIGPESIGSLYRVSDLLFMPSHREGFGMPVLEAGLLGLPVVSSHIPAAEEIGSEDIILFSAEASPTGTAQLILDRMQNDVVYRLRRKVRQNYTWQAIFQRDILPLISGEPEL